MVEFLEKKDIMKQVIRYNKDGNILAIVNIPELADPDKVNPRVVKLLPYFKKKYKKDGVEIVKIGFVRDSILDLYRNIHEMAITNGVGPMHHVIDMLEQIAQTDTIDNLACAKISYEHNINPREYFNEFCFKFAAYCWAQRRVKPKEEGDTVYGDEMVIRNAHELIDGNITPDEALVDYTTEKKIKENSGYDIDPEQKTITGLYDGI